MFESNLALYKLYRKKYIFDRRNRPEYASHSSVVSFIVIMLHTKITITTKQNKNRTVVLKTVWNARLLVMKSP